MSNIIELFKQKALHFANEEIGIQPLYAEIEGGESIDKNYLYSFSVQYKRNHDDTNCDSNQFIVKKRGEYYLVYLCGAMNPSPAQDNCIRWGRYIVDEGRNRLRAISNNEDQQRGES